jgi:phospholipid-binding lipoprotein MlaA
MRISYFFWCWIIFGWLTFPIFAENTDLANAQEEDDEYAEYSEDPLANGDPLSTWNHWMFEFNDTLYFWVLNPVAKGLKTVLPEKARVAGRNFFSHWSAPIRFVNCCLQGQWNAAGREVSRFGINTTVGFLGFFDPAKTRWKIESKDEDLGQTLARYGIPDGPYLILPFLGPSTLRDSVGTVGDFFLSPFFYLPEAWPVAVKSVEMTNTTSLRLGDYEAFKKAAIDPYDAFRDVYLQYRKEKIKK